MKYKRVPAGVAWLDLQDGKMNGYLTKALPE